MKVDSYFESNFPPVFKDDFGSIFQNTAMNKNWGKLLQIYTNMFLFCSLTIALPSIMHYKEVSYLFLSVKWHVVKLTSPTFISFILATKKTVTLFT